MTPDPPLIGKTSGLVLMLFGLAGVLAMATVFRPREPSPFAAHGAYGAGHGTESIMFGASPRAGVAP